MNNGSGKKANGGLGALSLKELNMLKKSRGAGVKVGKGLGALSTRELNMLKKKK